MTVIALIGLGAVVVIAFSARDPFALLRLAAKVLPEIDYPNE